MEKFTVNKINSSPELKFTPIIGEPPFSYIRAVAGNASAATPDQKRSAESSIQYMTETPQLPQSQEQKARKISTDEKQKDMSTLSVDQLKARWKRQVGSAKIAWGKLTENELLESEGHLEKLTGLVQERYAISLEEATRRVNNFFEAR